MRKLLRRMAKAKMAKEGVTHPNRHMSEGRWRKELGLEYFYNTWSKGRKKHKKQPKIEYLVETYSWRPKKRHHEETA